MEVKRFFRRAHELGARAIRRLKRRAPPQDVKEVLQRTDEFGRRKRRHHEELLEEERRILQAYERFTPEQRVEFFAAIYDRFADNYDGHMGVQTRHYAAMKNVIGYAGPYISAPLLDITAGTGELLRYAIGIMEAGKKLKSRGMDEVSAAIPVFPEDSEGIIVANEISGKMLEKAEKKLDGLGVTFTSHDAYGLPEGWLFNTVLCSQTFHLISEEDKTRLVQSIHRVLAPGGRAIILEEDPFVVSQTSSIEGIDIFLRAVACPIKKDALIGRFEAKGFTYLEHRAVHPIDAEHVMRLHLFEKN